MTRSYSLVDGFITAFDSRKPIVAAQLIRMQIDSPIRSPIWQRPTARRLSPNTS
jgi:hypothetical protein